MLGPQAGDSKKLAISIVYSSINIAEQLWLQSAKDYAAARQQSTAGYFLNDYHVADQTSSCHERGHHLSRECTQIEWLNTERQSFSSSC